MVLGTIRQEAGPHERQPKAPKTKVAQGGPLGSSPLRSVGSLMVMREAGPLERWPKKLKGELQNNSRKPRELVKKNWHSDSQKKRFNLLFPRVKRRREI
jgi:hypothetical protein